MGAREKVLDFLSGLWSGWYLDFFGRTLENSAVTNQIGCNDQELA